MKRIGGLILLVLFIPSVAFAYDGWSEGTIKNLRYQYTWTLIQQNGASNPGGCDQLQYLVLYNSQTLYDTMNAVLLTAYTTKANICLAVTGCSNGGTSGYPVVTEVWLIPATI